MTPKLLIIAAVIILVLGAGYYFVMGNKMSSPAMMEPSQAPYQTTSQPSTTTNSAAASSDNIYKTMTDPSKGEYLADFNGMALYTFDKDTPGVSNCYDKCAQVWPVYTSGATAQSTFPPNISVVTRKDGTKQFAWKGMPLYYYADDSKVGDIMGDGVGGIWHLVKP